jgi:hypothetical protein
MPGRGLLKPFAGRCPHPVSIRDPDLGARCVIHELEEIVGQPVAFICAVKMDVERVVIGRSTDDLDSGL